MQSLPQPTAPAREYRAIVPCDGYVHKFRLETQEEEAAAGRWAQPETPPAVHFGSLLSRFVVCALVVIGIAAAGARALI